MRELEAAFKIGLNEVVRVLDLALGAWVAGLIDDQVDLQTAGQVLECTTGATARIDHQMKGHAIHLLARSLGNGSQQQQEEEDEAEDR